MFEYTSNKTQTEPTQQNTKPTKQEHLHRTTQTPTQTQTPTTHTQPTRTLVN